MATKKEECSHCWHGVGKKHFPDWWVVCCKCHEWKKIMKGEGRS